MKVHKLAMNIINRVRNRINKDWQPKTNEGSLHRHFDVYSVDMSKGEWLVLSSANYFLEDAKKVLQEFKDKAIKSSDKSSLIDQFPEGEIRTHNTWGDTGKVVVNNWLGTIYQITHQDRGKPFMDGIDPANPLAYLTGDK